MLFTLSSLFYILSNKGPLLSFYYTSLLIDCLKLLYKLLVVGILILHYSQVICPSIMLCIRSAFLSVSFEEKQELC